MERTRIIHPNEPVPGVAKLFYWRGLPARCAARIARLPTQFLKARGLGRYQPRWCGAATDAQIIF